MKSIWSHLKNLFVELFIVFLGVFLAFQLNSYKENVDADNLKKNFYILILDEFQANLKEISRVKEQIINYLDNFKKSIAQKENPGVLTLKYLDIENNMLVLKSGFENGYLENINPKYISNMSRGSNHLTRLAKLMDRYNNSIDDVLKQNDWNTDLFYTKNHELKEKYLWIITDLEYIEEYLKQLENALVTGAIPDAKALIESE